MEVKVDIAFGELLTIVRKLTPAQKSQLKSELTVVSAMNPSKESLRGLLASGPTLTKKHISGFKQARKEINQWRAK